MNTNIFHPPSGKIQWSRPCHSRHLTEQQFQEMIPIRAVDWTYNAIGHLLDNHKTNSMPDIASRDIGDYYAIRILDALHMLVSQGKEESL